MTRGDTSVAAEAGEFLRRSDVEERLGVPVRSTDQLPGGSEAFFGVRHLLTYHGEGDLYAADVSVHAGENAGVQLRETPAYLVRYHATDLGLEGYQPLALDEAWVGDALTADDVERALLFDHDIRLVEGAWASSVGGIGDDDNWMQVAGFRLREARARYERLNELERPMTDLEIARDLKERAALLAEFNTAAQVDMYLKSLVPDPEVRDGLRKWFWLKYAKQAARYEAFHQGSGNPEAYERAVRALENAQSMGRAIARTQGTS